MLFKHWEIFLVDDEPDVLNISKLAMRDFEVYGLPLRIHTAESKAAALDLFNSTPELLPVLTVAFIDVVMETDTAGLELCQYLREEVNNDVTQLYIRTGQPGIAPERDVIDRYNISGYFTKAETTEDKLYTLVKSGVRQYLWSRWALGGFIFFDHIIEASDSRENLIAALQRFFTGIDGEPVMDTFDGFEYIYVGDELISERGQDERAAREIRDRLDQLEGTPFGTDGDKWVRDEVNNHYLIKIAPRPSKAAVYHVSGPNMMLPNFIIYELHRLLSGLATLWARMN